MGVCSFSLVLVTEVGSKSNFVSFVIDCVKAT